MLKKQMLSISQKALYWFSSLHVNTSTVFKNYEKGGAKCFYKNTISIPMYTSLNILYLFLR